MRSTLSRLVIAVFVAATAVSTGISQVATRAGSQPDSLGDRVGTDDGFALLLTASADGRGSLEMCGCGRQPLGGLARRVGYERAVLDLAKREAGLLRLDAGGAFDDTVDTGKNEVIPHIRNEWVLRGYLERDVAAINVAVSDLRYLSQMNVVEDRPARVTRFPMLDRIVSANVVPVGPGIVRFAPYVVREIQSPRIGAKAVRIAVVGVTVPPMSSSADMYGYQLTDPFGAVAAVVPEVRKQADVVVLLAYGPMEKARAIAEAVAGIDVVFVANNFFPDSEAFSIAGRTPLAPVVLQSRSLTEVRGSRSSAGAWQFSPRSVLLDEVIPSEPETLKMVYRARADFIR